MDKVRIGIIGCGGIANGKHMPSLKKLPDVEMVAFCDIIEEKAVKAAREFGVPGAKVFTDYKELLKEQDIDVVHVLTPNKQHSFITVDALEAGKHVMCEKPMAKSAADARRMVAAAKETGCIVTTEEHSIMGGLGSAVAGFIGEHCPVPVVRHGVNDEFGRSGKAEQVLEAYGLTPAGIATKVKKALEMKA